MQVQGQLQAFFETGCEGSMWAVYDSAIEGYEGLHFLASGDHLVVEYTQEQDKHVLLDVELDLINTTQALKHKYFKQYVRSHKTGLKQLQLAGRWIHKIPTNVDLALWGLLFFSDNTNYIATLTR